MTKTKFCFRIIIIIIFTKYSRFALHIRIEIVLHVVLKQDLIGKVESLQKELQGQKQDRQQMKKGTAILAEKLKEQTRQVYQ